MEEDSDVRYLSVSDVIAIHEFVMTRLGDAPRPPREEARLEAAVMRPRMAAYYEDADLVRQAALLAIGISQAQAFMDGNKRTAFAALRAFVGTNRLRFTGDPMELAQQLEAAAAPGLSAEYAVNQLEAWLRPRLLASNA